MKMKKITQLLVSSLLLLSISACGQKGPFEVPQDEPVLNIQTDETSTAR